MSKISCFTFILFLFTCTLFAQAPDPERTNEVTEDKLESIASATDEEQDFTTLLDKLSYYLNNPLNLNRASREDLEELTLLNELQINSLLEHIQKHGQLIALQELQTINGFDLATIHSVLPYVTVHAPDHISAISLKKFITQGKHVLFIRAQQVIEEAKGFSEKNPELNDTNRYLGSPLKLYARYRYTFTNRISFGITGEKDSGEEFFKGTQKNGFDFYSAHFFYNGNGLLKKLALGDFQAQFGQGLVLWSGLSFGKSSDVMNVRKNARGILPYTSTDENVFMRGVAMELGNKNFQADFFVSSKKVDANLSTSSDTLVEEDIITSFQEGGYHRTDAELHDKHSLGQTMYGGHLSYRKKNWNVGMTGYGTQLDRRLARDESLSNRFEFSGDDNSNVGIDYSYNYKNISFFGEAGRSKNDGQAYLNGALISLDKRLAITMVHRHYGKDYQALLGNALAESSTIGNEDGFYFGVSSSITRKISLNAYFDRFRFPWLRFQADAPSDGFEYLAQLNVALSKSFEAYARIKHQSKEENVSGSELPVTPLVSAAQTNYRVNVKYKVSSSVTLANRVEVVKYSKLEDNQTGFLIYQDLAWHPSRSKMTLSVRYALFDSDSYDTRLYAYETDVLYAYSFPSYYGTGSRYYLVLKYRIIKGIDIWLRYARTDYTNQDVISSGLDEITGSHKSEVKAQVRFTF